MKDLRAVARIAWDVAILLALGAMLVVQLAWYALVDTWHSFTRTDT